MLISLGAFHGINPGMGWLFAVALGMQERRRGAVLRALVPLGAGHALAVAAAVGVAFAIGTAFRCRALRWPDRRPPRFTRHHAVFSPLGIRAGWACASAWADSRCGHF